jgi:tetratricopeptide (TPR) repeat protein
MKQSIDREADTRRADELASRALAVDPNSYHAHQAKARLAQRRIEEAIVEARRSLSLNPGFIPAYRNLCVAAMYLGRPEETIEYADKAMRLSPLDPYLAFFHLFKGNRLFYVAAGRGCDREFAARGCEHSRIFHRGRMAGRGPRTKWA